MATMNKAKKKSGAEKIRQHNSHSFATEIKPNTSHAIKPRQIKQLRMNLCCKSDRLLNFFISIYNPNPKFCFGLKFGHDFLLHFLPSRWYSYHKPLLNSLLFIPWSFINWGFKCSFNSPFISVYSILYYLIF